ncbi:NUDIX hydrolase [Sediminitomix flava]|uniref:NUDIX domain-containing protein n=1 Tax=Sediminitomix flava TaxID=379075 RepID=A0A315Z6T9_SEDFL|nr:CoA pyrophosphatase [Sediminitomix flava]PWJ39942.1 NUDIX domain-containing protein [Sediminitomix flava]
MSNPFIEELAKKLKEDLPGADAHLKMASPKRIEESLDIPDNARKAAVLILLFPKGDSFAFPLIRRPQYNGVHSGQMAFPGGKHDLEDTDLVETALRECKEEVGVEVSRSQVIGTLSNLYIPPSNMLVTPVVAFAKSKPEYTADPIEVVEIIETDIQTLKHPNTKSMQSIDLGLMKIKAPAFMVDENVVWGATAMMLSELLEII